MEAIAPRVAIATGRLHRFLEAASSGPGGGQSFHTGLLVVTSLSTVTSLEAERRLAHLSSESSKVCNTAYAKKLLVGWGPSLLAWRPIRNKEKGTGRKVY